MLKKCTKCKTEKAFDCFTKATSSPDGLFSWCKPCHSAQRKVEYQRDKAKNQEKMKARTDKFRRENPEKNAEYAKAFRERNPESCKASTRKWYEANKEYKLGKEIERRKKDWEAYKEGVRKNRANRTPEQIEAEYERRKAYRQSRAAELVAWNAKRRAATKKRTPIWLTAEDIAAMEALYVEARRRTQEEGVEYHVDHVLPLQGKYVSGLHMPSNMQVLLGTENQKKTNLWKPD